jgi:hypothetical protein
MAQWLVHLVCVESETDCKIGEGKYANDVYIAAYIFGRRHASHCVGSGES